MEGNLDLRLLYPEDLANAGFILLRQGHPLSDKTKEGTREPCEFFLLNLMRLIKS